MSQSCIGQGGDGCDYRDLETLEDQNDWDHGYSRQGVKIVRCKKCGQLWKIRYQWDTGAGIDDIWVKPGETERHVSFPLEEAATYERSRAESGS